MKKEIFRKDVCRSLNQVSVKKLHRYKATDRFFKASNYMFL